MWIISKECLPGATTDWFPVIAVQSFTCFGRQFFDGMHLLGCYLTQIRFVRHGIFFFTHLVSESVVQSALDRLESQTKPSTWRVKTTFVVGCYDNTRQHKSECTGVTLLTGFDEIFVFQLYRSRASGCWDKLRRSAWFEREPTGETIETRHLLSCAIYRSIVEKEWTDFGKNIIQSAHWASSVTWWISRSLALTLVIEFVSAKIEFQQIRLLRNLHITYFFNPAGFII